MTQKKPATKKVAPRRQRITAAEIRRRELTQNARETIDMMDAGEVAEEVRKVALKQPGIFEYEVLMSAARRLDEPAAVAPKAFPYTVNMPPAGVQVGGVERQPHIPVPDKGLVAFQSPTADSTSGEDGAA